MAAFNQITQPKVAFGRALDVLPYALTLGSREDRKVFPIDKKVRVRPHVGSNFRGLVLLDGRPRGLQCVIVPERQLNGLFQGDAHRSLAECRLAAKRSHN